MEAGGHDFCGRLYMEGQKFSMGLLGNVILLHRTSVDGSKPSFLKDSFKADLRLQKNCGRAPVQKKKQTEKKTREIWTQH